MAVGRDVVRVSDAWIASSATGDPEDQVQPGSQIWVRVDADAGSNAWAAGVAYRLHVILLDIVNNYINMWSTVTPGHLNSGDLWSTQENIFTYGPITAPAQDHLLQIEAVLTSGVTGQGANVFQGDICVVAA